MESIVDLLDNFSMVLLKELLHISYNVSILSVFLLSNHFELGSEIINSSNLFMKGQIYFESESSILFEHLIFYI